MKTDLFAKMLVAVAFIASSGSAQTVDHDTTYSAADCKFFGNQASDNKLTYQSAVRLKNSSAADVTVTCPIVNPQLGAFLRWGAINVSNTTGWALADCNLFISSFDGSSLFVYSSPTLSVVGSAQQYLWPAQDAGATFDFGNMAFTCSVPPNGSIFKYESFVGH